MAPSKAPIYITQKNRKILQIFEKIKKSISKKRDAFNSYLIIPSIIDTKKEQMDITETAFYYKIIGEKVMVATKPFE